MYSTYMFKKTQKIRNFQNSENKKFLRPLQHLVEQLEVDAPEDLLVAIDKDPNEAIPG